AGVVRIAMRATAAADQRGQITVEKHDIGDSDDPIDPTWADVDRRKPRSDGSDFSARADLGNSCGQSPRIGTWTRRSGNLGALTRCAGCASGACLSDI